jgi:hypothetical protein
MAQPVTVTCDLYELWASHDKKGMDPEIPKLLGTRLNNDFKWTQYKLLSKHSKKLDKKKADTAKLSKGTLKLEFVEIVNKNQIRLNVDFTASTGKTTSGSPTTAAADWYTVVAKTSGAATSDAHVLGLSCK